MDCTLCKTGHEHLGSFKQPGSSSLFYELRELTQHASFSPWDLWWISQHNLPKYTDLLWTRIQALVVILEDSLYICTEFGESWAICGNLSRWPLPTSKVPSQGSLECELPPGARVRAQYIIKIYYVHKNKRPSVTNTSSKATDPDFSWAIKSFIWW